VPPLAPVPMDVPRAPVVEPVLAPALDATPPVVSPPEVPLPAEAEVEADVPPSPSEVVQAAMESSEAAVTSAIAVFITAQDRATGAAGQTRMPEVVTDLSIRRNCMTEMRTLALSVLLSGCCLSVAPDDTTGSQDSTGPAGTGAGSAGTGTGTGGQTSGGQTTGNGAATGSAGQTTGNATTGGSGTTGGACGLVFSSEYIDFGNTLINTTSKRSATLTNDCAEAALGISSALDGADQNLFTLDDGPTDLAAGASAEVDLSYSPLALETRSLADIVFTAQDGEHGTLSLFGEPVGVALVLSPNPCDFGHVPVNTTKVCCITVTDQANVAVTIKGFVNFATEDGVFEDSLTDDSTPPNPAPIPVTLSAGGSAKVCFSFDPPAAQQYSGQAILDTDDPSGTNPVVQLTGWGS